MFPALPVFPAIQPAPMFVRGRGISSDADHFFLDELVFHFNNCPEVPKNTFPIVVSIFENEQKFVQDVQSSISTEKLKDVVIGEHRYDPDFPVRKQFMAYSVLPNISRYTLEWMDKMDSLVCNPTTSALRKSMFQTIQTQQVSDLGYHYHHHHILHQYIMGVWDRLMTKYRFLTGNKTPFVIRPTVETDDMRYVSDQDKIDYLTQLQSGHASNAEIPISPLEHSELYTQHCLKEMYSYFSSMTDVHESVRHSHAVVFAYCLQKWCEVAIQSHYFDPVFYKKIRPDEDHFFILNYVCEIVMRIESIMWYVLHQAKETTTERIALNAVAPEDCPLIQTVLTKVKGQTAELRQGTATITDVRSLLHKAGFLL